jgi:hypothetical protein
MYKWQMDDPEVWVKSSLSDCTWLEDLSMDLSSRDLRTYEAKRTEEHLYIYYFYFISFLFFSHSFFLFFLYFFLTFLFFSSYIFYFFFCSSELLQHNTYIAFVRDDAMTPPPCYARPRAWKRGEMTAKVSINSIILQNIWISIQNFTPYSNWVVDKEVITKRYFWFRGDAQRSLWNFQCENPQCMNKKASMKKLHKGMTSFLVSNKRNQS